MILFVGLGNPGAKYARHRHNVGFMAVDRLAEAHRAGPWRAKHQAEVADAQIGGEKCLLMKPQTFMNLSGQAVQDAARFYKIPPERIIVFYDELDLAPGKVRVKTGGGAAGHNGIRSIDAHIGANFRRVRIGIGHPGRERVLGHVLSDFSKSEEAWLGPLLDAMASAAVLLTQGDDAGFMTRVAAQAPAPKETKEA